MNRQLRVSRRLARLCLVALIAAGTAVGVASPAQAAPGYVYTTFKGDAAADQELWVYSSTDGTNFSVLADTNYRGPSGVLRDPSIIQHNGSTTSPTPSSHGPRTRPTSTSPPAPTWSTGRT